MRNSVRLSMILWVLVLLISPRLLAYEAMDVKNGGTIKGKVTLNGSLPGPRVFPLVLYAFGSFCKKISDGEGNVLLREFNIDAAGGLQDAVVAIKDIREGKPFRHIKNEYVTQNCMFHPADVPENELFDSHEGKMFHVHPLVAVMENHQPIYVGNRDPILHNGQVYQKERGNRVLNFSIPVSDKLNGGYIHMDKGLRIVQMICGMHEYMQSWGWIVENPYYAKTRKGGEFVIDRIPPGTYQVSAWHPHLKPVVVEVTVPPNGTVELAFEFDSRTVSRPIYETQDSFRMGPYANPYEDVTGCEGIFCVTRELSQ